MRKQIGFIGLGKMGTNMVLNLADKKWEVIVYNRSPKKTKKIVKRKNISGSYSIEEFCKKVPKPRVIWLMITSGKAIDKVISGLLPHLSRGDIVIDGGNSFYETSIKRYNRLKRKGVYFLDVGVSGGVEGARKGACMMIGGNKSVFKRLDNLFRDMCVKDGYGYMGSVGAGHFVKGIHNAIEYGMMSSLNEGFEAIKKQQKRFGTELKEVAKVYDNGSIIQGKLTHWLYDSLKKPEYLDEISCQVPFGDTEKEMRFLEKKFKMPMLKQARLIRYHSRKNQVCGQIISALRNKFGGHKFLKKK